MKKIFTEENGDRGSNGGYIKFQSLRGVGGNADFVPCCRQFRAPIMQKRYPRDYSMKEAFHITEAMIDSPAIALERDGRNEDK